MVKFSVKLKDLPYKHFGKIHISLNETKFIPIGVNNIGGYDYLVHTFPDETGIFANLLFKDFLVGIEKGEYKIFEK